MTDIGPVREIIRVEPLRDPFRAPAAPDRPPAQPPVAPPAPREPVPA
jgi:hypothetical protein